MGCNIFQVVYKVHVAERGPLPRSSFPWFQDMFRSCVMEAASNTTCWFKGYTAPLWDCNSEEVAQLVVTRLSPIGRLHCVRMLGMGHALRPLSLYLSLSLSLCLFTHDFLGWLEILQIWSRMNWSRLGRLLRPWMNGVGAGWSSVGSAEPTQFSCTCSILQGLVQNILSAVPGLQERVWNTHALFQASSCSTCAAVHRQKQVYGQAQSLWEEINHRNGYNEVRKIKTLSAIYLRYVGLKK